MIVNNLFHSDLLLSQSIHHMPFEFIFPNIFQFTCVQLWNVEKQRDGESFLILQQQKKSLSVTKTNNPNQVDISHSVTL